MRMWPTMPASAWPVLWAVSSLHRLQRLVTTRGHHDEIQVGELRGERFGRRQVRLRQAQDRLQAAGIGGDQRSLDEAGAWRRVGQRHRG